MAPPTHADGSDRGKVANPLNLQAHHIGRASVPQFGADGFPSKSKGLPNSLPDPPENPPTLRQCLPKWL